MEILNNRKNVKRTKEKYELNERTKEKERLSERTK
jgi:hypothetical protein